VKICFHCVCFKPKNLPAPAERTPTIIFRGSSEEGKNLIIKRGPTFCQTNKIRISLDRSLETRPGNQK
jgi:hypothetical protein